MEKCQCGQEDCTCQEKNEFVILEEKLVRTDVIRNLTDVVVSLANVKVETGSYSLTNSLKDTMAKAMKKIDALLEDM